MNHQVKVVYYTTKTKVNGRQIIAYTLFMRLTANSEVVKRKWQLKRKQNTARIVHWKRTQQKLYSKYQDMAHIKRDKVGRNTHTHNFGTQQENNPNGFSVGTEASK